MIEATYAYVACRAFPGSHSWADTGDIPTTSNPRSKGIGYTDECTVCGTQRDSFYSVKGYMVSRRYRYPADYKLETGTTKADIRRTFLRKAKK